MTLSDGVKPKDKVFTGRGTILRLASIKKCSELAMQNVRDLGTILRWNVERDILFFRIGSELFPFMDHAEKGYTISDIERIAAIVRSLSEHGDFAREHDMRLEMHPGPYNCLASPKDEVVENTIRCLEMHSTVANLLGSGDELKINIHVGGTYGGDFEGTADRFCQNFERLSPNLRGRLTVENDDRDSMWSTQHLVELIHARTGIPVTFDYHHWSLCNQGEPIREAAALAFDTWGDTIPTTHFSSPREGSHPRAHADYIDGQIDDLHQREYDVMVEAKMKEKAVLHYLKGKTCAMHQS